MYKCFETLNKMIYNKLYLYIYLHKHTNIYIYVIIYMYIPFIIWLYRKSWITLVKKTHWIVKEIRLIAFSPLKFKALLVWDWAIWEFFPHRKSPSWLVILNINDFYHFIVFPPRSTTCGTWSLFVNSPDTQPISLR